MIDKEKKNSSSNFKGSFSYINLLADDGSFPHRTHPIGDPQTSRRNSTTSSNTALNGNFYKVSFEG